MSRDEALEILGGWGGVPDALDGATSPEAKATKKREIFVDRPAAMAALRDLADDLSGPTRPRVGRI